MKRVTFTGVGIPPRDGTCHRCTGPVRVGDDAFLAEHGHYAPLLCSVTCYAEVYPDDPDLYRIPKATPAMPPADDADPIW